MKRALETQQKRDFLVIPDAHEIFFSLFFITIDLLRYPSMYFNKKYMQIMLDVSSMIFSIADWKNTFIWNYNWDKIFFFISLKQDMLCFTSLLVKYMLLVLGECCASCLNCLSSLGITQTKIRKGVCLIRSVVKRTGVS